jgi:hypothetical protein
MKHAIVLSTVLAILAIASGANADIMTDNGLGFVDVVTIHAPGYLADSLTVYAGQFQVSYQGKDYSAYCVDLAQYSGSGDVTRINVLDVPNGDKIAYLWDTYGPLVHDGQTAAALGSAIWEVRFETAGASDISNGNFSISGNSAVAQLAQNMLNTLPAGPYTPAHPEYILQSDSVQDLFIGSMAGEIPEPGTISLLAMGGLALIRRRRT